VPDDVTRLIDFCIYVRHNANALVNSVDARRGGLIGFVAENKYNYGAEAKLEILGLSLVLPV
jgi:hypothetical protein